MSKNINIIAERLRLAESDASAIDPVSEIIGSSSIPLAYKIQELNTNLRIAKGARITGKKIGLTSPAVQKQLGVHQPDFGFLFDDMEIHEGNSLSVDKLIYPKVEGEIAFVLKSDISTICHSINDIKDAVEYAIAAIEIVDSRIKDWNIKISDTIADNASASHYVLSSHKKSLDEIDLINCTMQLSINNEIESTGAGKECMGNPLNALLWLSNKMVENGQHLKKGEVILSGALGKFVDVKKGDSVKLYIEGLGSASVSFD